MFRVRFTAATASATRVTRALSTTNTNTINPHTTQLVSNVTPDLLSQNPALEEYMRANFPQQFDTNYKAADPPHRCRSNSFRDELITGKTKTDYPEQTSRDYYPRNIRPLTTYLRDPETEYKSNKSRLLRYNGMIPGMLYGGNPQRGLVSQQSESRTFVKTPFNYLEREWDRYGNHMDARVYELTVLDPKDDSVAIEPQLVVLTDVKRHPYMEKMYCTNFLRYHPGRVLKLPVTPINEEESMILKRDGFLVPLQRRIEVLLDEDIENIPDSLNIECSGLTYKEVVRLDRLILPPGVRLSERVLAKGKYFDIAVVDGRARDAMEGEGGEEGATEASST